MQKETILIFGGNGFIGAETVEFLLDNYGDRYDLVLLNRDNWDDWDLETRIKPRIQRNIICDRKKNSLKDALSDYLKIKEFKFHAIIDFSGFKPYYIDQVIKHIPAEKINYYIYISTDSVYEVCDIDPINECNNYLLKETDSVRPTSAEKIKKLKDFDTYGDEKLQYVIMRFMKHSLSLPNY